MLDGATAESVASLLIEMFLSLQSFMSRIFTASIMSMYAHSLSSVLEKAYTF